MTVRTRAIVVAAVVGGALLVATLVAALVMTTTALHRVDDRMAGLERAIAGRGARGRPMQTSLHAVEGGVRGLRADLGPSLVSLVDSMDRVSARMREVVDGLDRVAGDTGTLGGSMTGLDGALTTMAGDTSAMARDTRMLRGMRRELGAVAGDTDALAGVAHDLGQMRTRIDGLDRRVVGIRGQVAFLPELLDQVRGLREITPLLSDMQAHLASLDRKLPGLPARRGR